VASLLPPPDPLLLSSSSSSSSYAGRGVSRGHDYGALVDAVARCVEDASKVELPRQWPLHEAGGQGLKEERRGPPPAKRLVDNDDIEVEEQEESEEAEDEADFNEHGNEGGTWERSPSLDQTRTLALREPEVPLDRTEKLLLSPARPHSPSPVRTPMPVKAYLDTLRLSGGCASSQP
jgi:hypothetical protein